MRARTGLIATLLLALAATTPATAAVKKKLPPPICNLVKDDRTDDASGGPGGLFASTSVDVVSADIATGPTEMVAVLRVKAINFEENAAKFGFQWRMGATAGGMRYEFSAKRGMAPSYATGSSVSINGAGIEHTFKFVKNTLVWTFKRSAPNAKVPMAKKGLVWGDHGAFGSIMSSTADTASSEKKYPDRARSCVIAR